MLNFTRALRRAFHFWPSIILATVCSFVVATLWGANIGAFYPILEVTMDGESMHSWMEQEVARYEQKAKELQQESADAQLKAIRIEAQDPKQSERLMASSASLSKEAENQRRKAANYKWGEGIVKTVLPNDPFVTIAFLVAALILSTLVKHFFLISGEVLVGRVALNVSREIRMDVFDQALSMDRAGYATFGTGGFTSSITTVADVLSNGIMNTLGGALREPLKMIACLVGAGMICFRLLLLSLIISPIVGFLLYCITRKIRDVARSQLEKSHNYHAVMLEGLGNIETVQAFGNEKLESSRFGDATKAIRDFGLKFVFYTSLSKPIIEFLGLGMLGTTIIGGSYLVLNNETSILGIQICDEPLTNSALLVFFGMLIGVSDPLRKLSAVYSSIYAGCMAADGLASILDRENEIKSPEIPETVKSPHSSLELSNVHFAYQQNQDVLKDISLQIPFGSTVGVIGHNGSGKSTLINLLYRFYDPTAGEVKLDGKNYRNLEISALRDRIAIVNQHTELFDESVAYNIRYGSPDATDAQVEQVARDAHAFEFISDLEQGFDTRVGQNGNRLSGGQRQRIALARALLCEPEILILDEATSQIDMKSEQLIRDSLNEHRGKRTMIIITHREKLLELADKVYEISDGQLTEKTELLQKAA